MRVVLALAVTAALATGAAAAGATTTATKQASWTIPEQFFDEKTKIPVYFNAACRDGNVDIVQDFLMKYPDWARALNTRIPAKGETCLHKAARNGHAEVIDMMIQAGSDPNIKAAGKEYGVPPLFWSVLNGNYDASKMLIRNGANINQVFESPESDGKMMTAYDLLMEMIERIGDLEEAKASGDEEYYRTKEYMERNGAKTYAQYQADGGSEAEQKDEL